jgi:hypothetical protein
MGGMNDADCELGLALSSVSNCVARAARELRLLPFIPFGEKLILVCFCFISSSTLMLL